MPTKIMLYTLRLSQIKRIYKRAMLSFSLIYIIQLYVLVIYYLNSVHSIREILLLKYLLLYTDTALTFYTDKQCFVYLYKKSILPLRKY